MFGRKPKNPQPTSVTVEEPTQESQPSENQQVQETPEKIEKPIYFIASAEILENNRFRYVMITDQRLELGYQEA